MRRLLKSGEPRNPRLVSAGMPGMPPLEEDVAGYISNLLQVVADLACSKGLTDLTAFVELALREARTIGKDQSSDAEQMSKRESS